MAAALVWTALALLDTIYAWQWQHIQFYSTIETLGGVTACLIAAVLFIKFQKNLDAHLVMLAPGFAVDHLSCEQVTYRAGIAEIRDAFAEIMECTPDPWPRQT